MWGRDAIATFEDSSQGRLGDCWLISVMSEIARNSDRVKGIFATKHFSRAGVYAFNLFHMGMPATVIIDDFLPFSNINSHFNRYGQIG